MYWNLNYYNNNEKLINENILNDFVLSFMYFKFAFPESGCWLSIIQSVFVACVVLLLVVVGGVDPFVYDFVDWITDVWTGFVVLV